MERDSQKTSEGNIADYIKTLKDELVKMNDIVNVKLQKNKK